MNGQRTGIDFSKHELHVTNVEGLLVHYLAKPGTSCDSIKYINTNGIMAVTGDYGNWVFCREFHPSEAAGVSESYWDEKLQNSSCQKPFEFDQEGTEKKVKTLLLEEENLTDEEKEYLNNCLKLSSSGIFEYESFAHTYNCGRFSEGESVPLIQKRKFWLNAVYDGFDEICRRVKEAATAA